MVAATVLVLVSITETVLSSWFAVKIAWPSGVIAMRSGASPTGDGGDDGVVSGVDHGDGVGVVVRNVCAPAVLADGNAVGEFSDGHGGRDG
jgi:hypothetical protein